MAWVWADRVLDTSVTAGTGALTLSGTSPAGWRTFSTACAVADTFYYTIHDPITGAWETGEGTYSALNTVTRTTVRQSSNANALVSFAVNAKNVFLDVIGYYFSTALPGEFTVAAGAVAYGDATGTAGVTGDLTNFSWDVTNKRLGIGTNAPAVSLDVRGAATLTGTLTGTTATFSGNTSTKSTLTVFGPAGVNSGTLNHNDTALSLLNVSGTTLNLGGSNATAVFIQTAGFYPITTKTKILGNASFVWNALHTVSSIFYGATSGTATVQASAVAGSAVLTLPAITGTVALTSDLAVMQTVSFQTGATATGTALIPFDNTIPQITEGTEFMTLAITPKSATSKLIIDVMFNGFSSVPADCILALFQDATANALAASCSVWAGTTPDQVSMRHVMTSGTTSATTFRLRASQNVAGTLTFNGMFGGVQASSIVIQEVAP